MFVLLRGRQNLIRYLSLSSTHSKSTKEVPGELRTRGNPHHGLWWIEGCARRWQQRTLRTSQWSNDVPDDAAWAVRAAHAIDATNAANAARTQKKNERKSICYGMCSSGRTCRLATRAVEVCRRSLLSIEPAMRNIMWERCRDD